jgi:hypothetical protein
MDLSDQLLRTRFSDIATRLDISKLGLFVSGIEVTQAVQYYHADEHLTDPADRGADNAVRLVAGKPAWARVYVGSLFGASGLGGTLEVQRRSSGFLWNTVATLNPTPPVPASVPGLTLAQYATIRETLGATLNFIIPADEMIGTLRLIARVSSGTRTAEHTISVAVTLRQTLRLAGVMIAYNGPASNAANAPNLTIAAPALTDLQAMAATALTLFPVQSTANFRAAGSITLTNHLQDTSFPTSGCGTGWDALHAQVANARTADGNQAGWIYYGLLPNGVPMGPVGGCGGGGVAVGPINQPGTLAHEAGHACGLEHAPAGGAPNPDPNYPAYEPYDPANTPQASIGEFGLNVNNGNIASPQTFRDFMAYGGPSWISLYHYGRLLSNATLSPVTVGIDHPWWKDLVWEELRKWPWIPLPDPPPFDFDLELPMYPPMWQQQNVISLIVRVEHGKVAEVLHVARTRMRAELDQVAATAFTAHLRGHDGELLAEAPLLRLDTSAGGCGCSRGEGGQAPTRYLAQALIPDVAPGAVLDIHDGKEVVWERKAPGESTRIDSFEAKLDRKGNLQLRWSASRTAVEFWLRWSTDGERWQSLATGLTDRRASLETRQLPAGKVLLQLVAHDGFHSVTSKPVAIRLPERAPEIAILHPVDGNTYSANQTLRLWGSASTVDGGHATPRRCTWLLGKQEIGQGLDTWSTLEPGRHTLTLRVENKGGVAESSVSVTVVRHGESAGRAKKA